MSVPTRANLDLRFIGLLWWSDPDETDAMNSPDWTTLRIFLAALELGSVTKALESAASRYPQPRGEFRVSRSISVCGSSTGARGA